MNLPGISVIVTRLIGATGICVTSRGGALVVARWVSITIIVATTTVPAVFPAVTIFPARRVAVDTTAVAIVITVVTTTIVAIVAVATIITATITVRVVAAVAGIIVATPICGVRGTAVIVAITTAGRTATEVCNQTLSAK